MRPLKEDDMHYQEYLDTEQVVERYELSEFGWRTYRAAGGCAC
jgi:hypothetical protein